MLLEDLSLSLNTGDILWLTGPNGSGKTTLLLACAGLIPLDHGAIRWGSATEANGMVSYAAFTGPERDGLTLGEELGFWQTMEGDPTPLSERLAAVGLDGHAQTPVIGLSAGQRRRLSLARLSLSERPIWLLDEPLSGLDTDGQARVMEAVARHSETGGIALIASHQPLALPRIAAKQLVFESAPASEIAP